MNDRNQKKELEEIVRLEKPVLVSAGPGMGKTYTLAYKLKYLVETKRIDPGAITVITFTNEAAINMRRRISNKRLKETYIEPELQPINICTMHKLGHGIVKRNAAKLGLNRNINILSTNKLKEILVKDCAQIIGASRADAKETIMCRQKGRCKFLSSTKCKICTEYKSLLRKFNYIDHDDQILLTCEVLKKEANVLENEQRKAKYLLVDEYQDINYAQWELIQLLSRANTENLFVVGDKYQSIYGFRGGSPEYIENFERDYAPKAVSCKLTSSFRCPPNIFKGAYRLVQRYNSGNIDFADKIDYEEKSNIPIKICEFDYGNQEAAFLARKVKDIGPSYDSLILVPTLNYANPIRSALRKMFVDFSCNYDVEDTDMYIICSLIEWLKETSNNFSFRLFIDKIISKKFKPKEKQAILQKISNFWQEVAYKKTLYQRIKTLINDEQFKRLPVAIAKIRKIWKDSEGKYMGSNLDPDEVIANFIPLPT